jgi:hypothetical protein
MPSAAEPIRMGNGSQRINCSERRLFRSRLISVRSGGLPTGPISLFSGITRITERPPRLACPQEGLARAFVSG